MPAPRRYLPAATVVGPADTASGPATRALLPGGAVGLATTELETAFPGTGREGRIDVGATDVHAGRTTQVWDAVDRAEERTTAPFRCTQSVLRPK